MTYKVTIKEITEQDVYVDAESKEDAIMAVRDGMGDYRDNRYAETLDPELWFVQEIEEGENNV